jgi:hypothetical protein
MGAGGSGQLFHGRNVASLRGSFAYDPSRFSPGAVRRAIQAAVEMCAAVEGLSVAPGISQPVARKVLQDPLATLRRELVAIHAILPRDEAR